MSTDSDSLSSSSQTPSFCRRNKRRRHSDVSQDSNSLPECVSKWKRYHAHRVNISYAADYIEDPQDLFKKLEIPIKPITDEQSKYLDKIKSYLHFDVVSSHDSSATSDIYTRDMHTEFKPQIDELLEVLRVKDSSLHSETHSSTEMFLDSVARMRVFDFIVELLKLLKVYENIYQLVKMHVNVQATSSVLQLPVASKFMEMCHLRAESGNGRKSVWTKLLGADVSSEPDIRLYSKGISQTNFEVEQPETCISVIEVKKDSCQRLDEVHTKRKVLGAEDEDKSINIPNIAETLSEDVLGRHAGQLLLEIHSHGIRTKDGDLNKLFMLGMVIDGTKVYFTLLEMTEKHFRKLERMENLNSTDEAIVHYVKPLDIIFEEERNVLLKSCVMLNNICK